MKKLVGYDHDFGGGDVKGAAGAQLGIEGSDIIADVHVKARVPIAIVAQPAFKVIDQLVDKIEAWIPGDQTAIAAGLKADARAQLVKLLSEQAKPVGDIATAEAAAAPAQPEQPA